MPEQTDRRAAILDATRAILAETSTSTELTLSEVARRAGVTRTTLYRYFRNRDELLAAVGDVAPPDQDARRGTIVAAALRCVARWGIRGATMERIGREAGISPAAIYWYFPSKDDLITALLESHTPLPDLRMLRQLPVGAEEDQIRQLTRRVLALLEKRLDVIKTVIGEGSSRPDLMEEIYRDVSSKLIAELSAYLDQRVAAGVFRPGPNLARAMAFIAPLVAYTFVRQNLGDRIPLDYEADADEFSAILLHGISRQTAPTPRPDGHDYSEAPRSEAPR